MLLDSSASEIALIKPNGVLSGTDQNAEARSHGIRVGTFGGTAQLYDTICICFDDTCAKFDGHPYSGISLSHLSCLEGVAIRLETVADKGIGMVATVDIFPGTCILRERPLLVMVGEIPTHIEDHLEDCLRDMMPERKAAFFRLHSCKHREPPIGSVLDIVLTNSFGLKLPYTDDLHIVVYDRISRANHCCTPNAIYTFDHETFCGELTCQLPISAGEEITIRYCDVLLPAAERMEELKRKYDFTCTCPACTPSTPTFTLSEHRRNAINRLLTNHLSMPVFQLSGGCDDAYVDHVLDLINAERLPEQHAEALSLYAQLAYGMGQRDRASNLAQMATKELERYGLLGRSVYRDELGAILAATRNLLG